MYVHMNVKSGRYLHVLSEEQFYMVLDATATRLVIQGD
jgi:hypothetical protein